MTDKVKSESIQQERYLLILCSAILLNGFLVVSLVKPQIDYWLLAAVSLLIVMWFAVHSSIRQKSRGDGSLLPLALLLSAIGLIVVYRLKPELFLTQLGWNAIGLTAFVATAHFCRNLERLADYKYLAGVAGVGLLLSAAIFGVEIGGNKNWVILGPVRFQPAEFAKLFIILFLAAYLTERREVLTYATRKYGLFMLPQFRFAAPLLAVWGITMVMLVFQRDLGSALLYFGTTLTMIYLASGRIRYILQGMLLFTAGAAFCYFLFPHVKIRVDIWLNPWSDPNGKAYQIVQSLFAMGSGGVLGSGLTYGFPTFIPEVHTDFVFAAIGEEMGFLGAAAVLLTYMLLLYRAFSIAIYSQNSFQQLTVGGLATFLGLQTLLIIGGVTKFLPLTGITLPFISYGGSSLISNFILLGILYAASESGVYDA